MLQKTTKRKEFSGDQEEDVGDTVIVTIGSSSSGEKICRKAVNTVCAKDAGDKGKRANTDYADADDSFVISSNVKKSEVCAQRTYGWGWGMNLQLKCKKSNFGVGDPVIVTIGKSRYSSYRCAFDVENTICPIDAGNKGKRANWWDSFSDSFIIESDFMKKRVCARRQDEDSGWGMNLKLKCARGRSVIVDMGDSSKNTKCVMKENTTCEYRVSTPWYAWSITSENSKICAKRTYSSSYRRGWTDKLKLKCLTTSP